MQVEPVRVNTESGFLMERLGHDTDPLQGLRETAQNSWQQHERAHAADPLYKGQVHVDVDWQFVKTIGVYKRVTVDDGPGFDPATMPDVLNNLFSTTGHQAMDGNFGVGARITEGFANRLGLEYLSWRDGQGQSAVFRYGSEQDQFGLERFQLSEDEFDVVRPADESRRHSMIKRHGVMAVCLGSEVGENTYSPPASVRRLPNAHWVAQYLTRRYFEVPEYIDFRARRFASGDPTDWGTAPGKAKKDGNWMERIRGMKWWLDRYALASGCSRGRRASVHWWLLPKKIRDDEMGKLALSCGQIGILFQNELYDVKSSSHACPRLGNFGIDIGKNRVALYVEPNSGEGAATDTARSSVTIGREQPPWAEWAEEFRNALPEPLKKLQESVKPIGAEVTVPKDVLKRLAKLNRPPARYRRKSQGVHQLADDEMMEGGSPPPTPPRNVTPIVLERPTPQVVDPDSEKPSKPHDGGRSGERDAETLANKGNSATPIVHKPERVETRWVRLSDGTRSEDDLVDRAGRYYPERMLLELNWDWWHFESIRLHLENEFGNKVEGVETSRKMFQVWMAHQLSDAAELILSVQRRKTWNRQQTNQALSEEAITMAAAAKLGLIEILRNRISDTLKGTANGDDMRRVA